MDQNVQELSFFAKLKKGLIVALKSLKFVWHHKKLIFFPIMMSSFFIGSIGIYDIIFYQFYGEHITTAFQSKDEEKDEVISQKSGPKEKIEFVLFSLIITFIGIFFCAFFNVALSHATTQAFEDKKIELGASIKYSFKKFPSLLMWTFCAFFVHILVNIIKNQKKESVLSRFLIRFVGRAIEISWYIGTFLVIPLLAHENIGALKSIRRSGDLMKQTFGENFVGALLLPELTVIVILIWFLVSLVIGFPILYFIENHVSHDVLMKITFTLFVFNGFLLLVAGVFCAIISAATTVFKTAVYHYAVGNPLGLFDAQEIEESFITEAKKLPKKS